MYAIEDALWDPEDVCAIEDEEWDPEQVELRLLQALPRISWSTIRAVIRVARDAFAKAHEEALRKKEEEARAQEAAAAAHSVPPLGASQAVRDAGEAVAHDVTTDEPVAAEPEQTAQGATGGLSRQCYRARAGKLPVAPSVMPTAPDQPAAQPPEQAPQPGGRENLLDWGARFLPEHFSKPPSAMHRWMAERLDAMGIERGAKLNVLGPRGGAKSTLATLAYPLRAALEASEPYIWIVSDTKAQAFAHLENLKLELVDNPRIAQAYPAAAGRGPVWRAGRIVMRNGVTLEAFGTGQRIRGRRARQNRPTLIVCDDLENDTHMESAARRSHVRQWFQGALMQAGTPLTNVVNLATALHREALAMELTSTPGWTSRVFRSIDPWPFAMGLWDQWEAIYADPHNPDARHSAREFYERHQSAMDAGAGVLWPQVEDLYTLMCTRAEGGRAAFEREKQNSPMSPDLCEWPETYFHDKLWFDDWPKDLRVKVLALDPSKGSDAGRGDYSAFVCLGVDRDGILYVEADLARRPTPEIVADGVELVRRMRPDAFGVEANQFQELLAAEFASEFRRQGLLGVHPWLIQNDVNKRVRIRRLGPLLASRRLRLKADSPSTRLLVEQLQQFPVAEHDDGPDALEMAVRLAQEMLTGQPNDGLGNRLPVEW